jgi:ribonuclease P protein component
MPGPANTVTDAATDRPEATPPGAAVILAPKTLRKRSDFLKAAHGRRQGTAGFLLQARARGDGTAGVRVGFTASKKIGNAVLRNRARRRLRAVMRAVLPALARDGWDYVLVARPEATISRSHASLLDDLRMALASVHKTATPAAARGT